MTTDLTGDFELGEDEFDWDVFLPDPDDTDMAADAASLDDADELSLDDSDFDWERALREDPETESDTGARAGAAYDRIVDTMRPSVAEPEPASEPESGPELSPAIEAEPPWESVAAASSVSVSVTDSEPDLELPGDELAPASPREIDATWEPVPEVPPPVTFSAEPDWGGAAQVEAEAGAGAGAGAGADGWSTHTSDTEQWWEPDRDLFPSTSEPERESTFEPQHAAAPIAWEFAEPALGVGTAPAADSDDMLQLSAEVPADLARAWGIEPGDAENTEARAADLGENHAGHARRGKPKRSRVFKATVVVACLALLAAAAAGVRALHHPATGTAPPAHVTTPTSPTTSAADIARVQAATQAVSSATTAANVGITSLASFPTPTNVQAVVNPYISSLQLYQTFLGGSTIPAAAQPAAASAEAQLRQDLTFLDTIDGLPAQQLGAFLEQFVTNATHLQTTLTTLEQTLRTPSS